VKPEAHVITAQGWAKAAGADGEAPFSCGGA
jgi:hypothetical protein